MIKASAKNTLGQSVLFLGLSGDNVARLAAGEPIRILADEAAQLGLPPVEVILHYGTEQSVLDDLAGCGATVDTVMWPGDAAV